MAPWNELRILNAVLRRICEDDFTVTRPDVPREKYKSIRRWYDDRHENERLETVGDSILWMCFTLRMYEQEDATPGMITKLKNVLLSNMVLALVAEKSDSRLPVAYKTCSFLHDVQELLERQKRGEQVKVRLPKARFKPTADKLEALAAALHMAHGLDAARQWFDSTFEPLIEAGIESTRQRTNSALGAGPSSSPQKGKKRMLEDASSTSQNAKRMRTEAGPVPATFDQKGKGKVNEPIPDDAVVIDLTIDDISDDEVEEALDEEVEEDEDTLDNEHSIIDLTADDSDEYDDDGDLVDEHARLSIATQVDSAPPRAIHPLPRRPHVFPAASTSNPAPESFLPKNGGRRLSYTRPGHCRTVGHYAPVHQLAGHQSESVFGVQRVGATASAPNPPASVFGVLPFSENRFTKAPPAGLSVFKAPTSNGGTEPRVVSAFAAVSTASTSMASGSTRGPPPAPGQGKKSIPTYFVPTAQVPNKENANRTTITGGERVATASRSAFTFGPFTPMRPSRWP
ncbi:unnamed protein product [Peniophora sp. CBMAI 1063]|nr:unnamed protein product [Peniophora sp. CBMAI 1063]